MWASISFALLLQSGQDLPALRLDLSGTPRYRIVSQNAEAQRYIDQGLLLLVAFHKGESEKSFKAAMQLDSSCAFAYWGYSEAIGPDINVPSVSKEDSTAAMEALRKGKEHASGVDRELIDAALLRFDESGPPERSKLNTAYADAMRDVWKRHPDDALVGSIFAESLLDKHPWDQWTPDGKPKDGTEEAIATLKAVLAEAPKDPFANHLWIHTVEASPHPEWALNAASVLVHMKPELGHLVHMPAHIYVRTGMWDEAIEQNQKAIANDKKIVGKRPVLRLYNLYMIHNRMMLAFAATMVGRSKVALQATKEIGEVFPPEAQLQMAPMFDGYAYMPLDMLKRFGKWDEILKAPQFPKEFPFSRAMQHGIRAVAYAAKGEDKLARQEEDSMMAANATIPDGSSSGMNDAKDVFAVMQHLAKGEVRIQRGDWKEGIAELQAGVAAEDKLRYDEPPDWTQPVRHTLGATLLKRKLYKEAVKVFEKDLTINPHNGWSLQGLANAYSMLGNKKKAQDAMIEFDHVWRNADFQITTSCLCMEPKR